jgi:hypothetical protein
MHLSISQSGLNSEIWRFESQQWRMGKSLFEDRKGYKRNSPSTYVDNITTPLLIWGGEIDRQVNPKHCFISSIEKIGKEKYHVDVPQRITFTHAKKNQIDLYNRHNDWLAFYFKDEKPADWIAKGIGGAL